MQAGLQHRAEPFSPRDGDDPAIGYIIDQDPGFSPRDGDDPAGIQGMVINWLFSPRDGDDPQL